MVNAVLIAAAAVSSLLPSSTPVGPDCPVNPTCPANDGCLWRDATGLGWMTGCYTNLAGGDMVVAQTNDFTECVNACSVTPGCVGISYTSGFCYLKESQQPPVVNPVVAAAWITGSANAATPTSNAYSACPSTITCPENDSCSWMSTNGRLLTIRCNRDFYGGDAISRTAGSLADCVGLCLNLDVPCVAVSYDSFQDGNSGGLCFLKSQMSTPVYDSHIHAAYINKNIVGAPKVLAPVRPGLRTTTTTITITQTTLQTVTSTSSSSPSPVTFQSDDVQSTINSSLAVNGSQTASAPAVLNGLDLPVTILAAN
ncbi:hypothetical protein K504DRAFT_491027 [Pleomassaria siparia CBS 279.74]|uniref:Apple domain-containing protein n=1 Tax=Pleomassaria siparia CBS 279.74 TaxID=1314801 RepID=A0A6G1KAI7_9PLEO|nr:hypothetical protein K504DRAFT_491027 [Pleomassaria siparia CBS 279.74]